MPLEFNELDMIPFVESGKEREGWYLLRQFDHDPQRIVPPEEYWLCVSPKLRLFEYPGGPARGQISKHDFNYHMKYLDAYYLQSSRKVREAEKNLLFAERYGHEVDIDITRTVIEL